MAWTDRNSDELTGNELTFIARLGDLSRRAFRAEDA